MINLEGKRQPRVDVMFLSDATGSMIPSIDDVRSNFLDAYKNFCSVSKWDVQIGLSFYRDSTDPIPFEVLQKITGDDDKIQKASQALSAQGGGDRPEAQMYALTKLASDPAATGFRPGSIRIIAWFGDEPGHNPVVIGGKEYTQAGAIAALQKHNVQVCAFSVAPANRLDQRSQATEITNAADGVTTGEFVKSDVKQDGVVEFIYNFIRGDVP